MELTSEQERIIRQFTNNLREQLQNELSEQGWKKERDQRQALFTKLLSEKNINNLSEANFRTIIKSLWAFIGWTNKDYVVDKIIENNGFNKIKKSLKEILYSKDPLETRFDNFKVKGLGTSSLTEILVFVDPRKYCLWNDKPRKVLPHLGIDQISKKILNKSQITGNEYVKCNEVLDSIRKILLDEGFEKIDFLDLDIFIWLIFNQSKKLTKDIKKEPTIKPTIILKETGFTANSMSHWDAIGIIVELGKTLDYETYVADPSKKYKGKLLSDFATSSTVPEECKNIKGIERVDVIWFSFEPPFYLFEVEDKGTMREALHRLFQARYLKSKFFVVSPFENRNKFEKYVMTDPFRSIRNQYLFRSYEELLTMYNMAVNFQSVKSIFFEEK